MIPEVEEYREPEQQLPPRMLSPSASMPSLSDRAATPTLTNTQFKKELAYKEAMDRHIAAMEARASEVMAEKQQWSQHVQDCMAQEREEEASKRQKAGINLHYLQHQIASDGERKKQQ